MWSICNVLSRDSLVKQKKTTKDLSVQSADNNDAHPIRPLTSTYGATNRRSALEKEISNFFAQSAI